MEEEEEIELLDCPACSQEYDGIDAEYLICTKCGWNENSKSYDLRKVSRGMFDECGNLRTDIL